MSKTMFMASQTATFPPKPGDLIRSTNSMNYVNIVISVSEPRTDPGCNHHFVYVRSVRFATANGHRLDGARSKSIRFYEGRVDHSGNGAQWYVVDEVKVDFVNNKLERGHLVDWLKNVNTSWNVPLRVFTRYGDVALLGHPYIPIKEEIKNVLTQSGVDLTAADEIELGWSLGGDLYIVEFPSQLAQLQQMLPGTFNFAKPEEIECIARLPSDHAFSYSWLMLFVATNNGGGPTVMIKQDLVDNHPLLNEVKAYLTTRDASDKNKSAHRSGADA